LIAGIKAQLKEEAALEMKMQSERQQKTLMMYTEKAENDLTRVHDMNRKEVSDLKAKFEHLKTELITKLGAQHTAELERHTKIWEAKCAVSAGAVKALDNPQLAASIVERQRKVHDRIKAINPNYQSSIANIGLVALPGIN
jgi:hypothetical protein